MSAPRTQPIPDISKILGKVSKLTTNLFEIPAILGI